MFELAQAAAVQKYAELKQHFEEKRTSDPFEKIEDKYIVSFGDILYIDGESLQEYLKRRHLDGSCKYPVQFYQYLSEESGFAEQNVDYRSSCENRAEAEYAWDEELSDFIDKMDDYPYKSLLVEGDNGCVLILPVRPSDKSILQSVCAY